MAEQAKALPLDLDAEAAVLSAMILDASDALVDEVRGIVRSRDCFYHEPHKHIFDAICGLAEAGQPQDAVTIRNWLAANDKWQRVGPDNLVRVIDGTPSIPNVLAHAAIVRDLHRVRRTIQEAGRIRAEAVALQGSDPEQLREFLQANEVIFSDLAHEGRVTKLRAIADVMQDVHRTIAAAYQQKTSVTGVPTGFTLLDRMTTGLQEGDLSVIAGRPGAGKTALALSKARNIASVGFAVAFFSLEMPAEQLGLRLLSIESSVDLSRLRTGRLSPGEWAQLATSIKRLAALPLFVNDTPGITLMEVRACVRQLQREIDAGRHPSCTKGRIGAVLIDYLQLMQPGQRGRSREEEVAENSRGLKRTAKDQSIPYVAVSQLNRAPEHRTDPKPRLSDLRESGSIEADADNVLFVYRAEQYIKDDPELKGEGEIIVAKQRNGPTGTIKAAYKAECTRWENIEYGRYEEEDDDMEQQAFDDTFGGVP